jgi:hypothetical protein
MTKLSRLFIALSIAILGGCAADASGPQFTDVPASGDRAVIYVYATSDFAGYGEAPVIEIDGREIGKLKPKGYFATEVSPGVHKVTMRSVLATLRLPGWPTSITAPAGGKVYMRVFTKYEGLSYSPSGPIPIYINLMKEVPPEVGSVEIISTRASMS